MELRRYDSRSGRADGMRANNAAGTPSQLRCKLLEAKLRKLEYLDVGESSAVVQCIAKHNDLAAVRVVGEHVEVNDNRRFHGERDDKRALVNLNIVNQCLPNPRNQTIFSPLARCRSVQWQPSFSSLEPL